MLDARRRVVFGGPQQCICQLTCCSVGTGDRSMEAPGTATESIPAVSLDYTCGGVYQTFSLVNNTTPLSAVLNKSSSSWSMSTSINVYHLYEVSL